MSYATDDAERSSACEILYACRARSRRISGKKRLAVSLTRDASPTWS
ncbi:hypothetical protein FHW69_000005 [Luteibacter sp. Sphag1AF]|nr:hypothetical protein [Luteibacter sp. Sphag1AF]MBB3225415.1 hypothetical protein [Luteibacter sp. Sphag1AF]